MDKPKSNDGKRIRLSNGRRLVSDVIRIAQKMPLAAVGRTLDLSELNFYRRFTRPKISWNILMLRAYGLLCQRQPELRQLYVRFPWPHMYQHDESVCMMTVAREYEGQERLFFARFCRPEEQSLAQLQERYNQFREKPVEQIPQFRHQIRFAKYPALVRRFAWWTLFNVWPSKRASHMGTFGMSLSGYKEAEGTFHLGPNTTVLGTDARPHRGQSKVLLTFDHRVIDGKPATEVIDSLRKILQRGIMAEVKMMIKESGRDMLELHRQFVARQSRQRLKLDQAA